MKPGLRTLFLTFASALALGGCAQMPQTPPGTPIAAVEKQFGQPTITCPLPDGGFRAVWSQQPFGEYAWGTDVDASGKVGEITQLLNDKFFNDSLGSGVWDTNRVYCTFGPPADIGNVGLPSVTKTVWSYRYRQYGVWYSMMYVFFDPATNLVVDHYPGPDPWYLDDRWLFW